MQYKGFDENFSLKGKTALVTGSANGIGKAIATLFAKKGANIILMDISKNLKATAEELIRYGTKILPLTCDITSRSAVDAAAEESLKVFKKIDIAVNCAGIALMDKAENLTEEYWDRTMAVNLKSMFLVCQAVGRHMIATGGGKIVNMASKAGFIAIDEHLAYTVSKAGVIGLTKALALEWGKYGINVNAISPTIVMTELGKSVWSGEKGEQARLKHPVGRFAEPEEIAAAALYLASDAAGMVTGSNLVIDGGDTID